MRSNILAKKFISLMLALAVPVTFALTGFAKEIDEKTIPSESKPYITLTNNNTGHKFKVNASTSLVKRNILAESLTRTIMGNTVSHQSQGISFTVDKDTIQPLASSDSTRGEWDSTNSVHGVLALNYNRISNGFGSGDSILLTNVNGYWETHNRVTVSQTDLFYACIDPSTYYSQCRMGINAGTSSYSFNTGFTHAVLESGNMTACGAHIKATLRHGTASSWTMEIGNTLFNSYNLSGLK